MRSTGILLAAVLVLRAAALNAQQRPLDTQDPETVGSGHVRVDAGVSVARNAFYPLSGLQGTLWQLPIVGFDVGLSPIADLQLTGGPYDRLGITSRQPAPLAGVVTATGDATHAVDDVNIGTKIRIVAETATRPAFGFRFSVRLPNAKHESGMGQDTTDFSASVLTAKTIGAWRVVGNLGSTIMSEPLDATKQNDVLTYGLSIDRGIPHHLEVVAEVNGRVSTRNGVPPVGTESRGEAKVGGRYTHGSVTFDAAAFWGTTSIDPTIGVTGGVSYTFTAFSVP